MNTFIVTIFIIACIFLILTVLLQTGKGAGLGSTFGGSSGMFTSNSPSSFISKVTWLVAAIFMISALTLAHNYKKASSGNSVMESSAVESVSQPAVDAGNSNINPETVTPAEKPVIETNPNAVNISKTENTPATEENSSDVSENLSTEDSEKSKTESLEGTQEEKTEN